MFVRNDEEISIDQTFLVEINAITAKAKISQHGSDTFTKDDIRILVNSL